jgi:hypothetical protein
VRFVDDDEVPRDVDDAVRFPFRELVGADDDFSPLKRAQISRPDRGVVGFRFEDAAREEELLGQFLIPLLPQVGRRNDEHPPIPLCPFLGEHEASFDRLAKPDFIRKQRTFGKRRLECEQRGIDLMWIEVYLCIDQRTRKLLYAVWGTALR